MLSLLAATLSLLSVGASGKTLASFDNSAEVSHGEWLIRRHLETWLDHVDANGIDKSCQGLFSPPEANNNASLLLVKTDGEGTAKGCQDYTFSGKLQDGFPHGKGTLKFKPNKLASLKGDKKCLIPGKVFGSDVVQLKGNFKEGLPTGKVTLKWGNGIRAELFAHEGLPHGIFKVEAAEGDKRVWTVGNVREGVVTDECWIVTDEQIRYGNCTDAFTLDPELPTVLLYRTRLAYDTSSGAGETELRPTQASAAVLGRLKGDQLVDAHDCEIAALIGDTKCARQIRPGTFRPKFVYDLKTRERKFKLYKPDGLCPEGDGASGRDASSQALRDYFDGLSLEKGLGMPLDDTKLDRAKSRKLLTELEHLGGNKYEAMFSLFSTSPIEFRHQGDLDGKGRFSGYTVLRVAGKESCYRGKCAFPTYMRIAGHFVEGELQGPVSLISRENMRQTLGFMVTDGVVHSLVVGEGLPLRYPHKGFAQATKTYDQYSFNSNRVGLVARFVNGYPEGKMWLGMVGSALSYSGFLYGVPTSGPGDNVTMSGADVAYLYPWYESALVGRFEHSYMREGRYARVSAAKCSHNLMEPEFELVQEDEAVYTYDPPTAERVASDLLLRDPYEAENVVVKPSVILSSGDGLFTTRPLRKGQLVALYAGQIFTVDDPVDQPKYNQICKDIKDSRSPCDRYSISTHMGATIILPPPMDDWSVNRVTSAWKTNNGFDPDTHTYFHDVEHPRFGLVPAISALRDVDAGVELLIDYQYNTNAENTTEAEVGNHAWWFKARKEHFARLAVEREESKEEGESKQKETGAPTGKSEL